MVCRFPTKPHPLLGGGKILDDDQQARGAVLFAQNLLRQPRLFHLGFIGIVEVPHDEGFRFVALDLGQQGQDLALLGLGPIIGETDHHITLLDIHVRLLILAWL